MSANLQQRKMTFHSLDLHHPRLSLCARTHTRLAKMLIGEGGSTHIDLKG
jgi:hypothetical protein